MASTVWRGYISFGLISIPVRLFRAARRERVQLRRVYSRPANVPIEDDTEGELDSNEVPATASQKRFAASGEAPEVELSRVSQQFVSDSSDRPVPQASLSKGYEFEKGHFVQVSDSELKSLVAKTSTAMEIEEFVPLNSIDPVYFEASYYIVPEEAGQKAYSLLYASLQNTKLVAIAQFSMHSREHTVIIRPGKLGLLAHTMFYVSEVRADEEYRTSESGVSAKELQLADKLVRSLETIFEPEKYRDLYRERLQALVDEKVQGRVTRSAQPEAPKPTQVVDIADALRRSLAEIKKRPPKSASTLRQTGKAG